MRSESYDTASIQHSDSVRVSTQLVATCGWFESNGTSTQHSESEFPSTPFVVLESGLWPNRPRVPTQLWMTAAEIAVHANVSSASLRRAFSLPCQGTSSLSSLWRIVPSLLSLTEILTLLLSDF